MRKVSMKKTRGASTVAAAVSLALVGSFVHPVVAPDESAVAVAADKGSSADTKTDPQNDGDSKKDPFADLPKNCLPTILGTTIPVLFLLPLALGYTLHIPGFESMSPVIAGANRQIGEALGYNYGPVDEAVKQHNSIYDVSHAKIAPEHPMPPAPPVPQGPDFIGGAAAAVLAMAALGLSLGMCLAEDEDELATNELAEPVYPEMTVALAGMEARISFGRFVMENPHENLPDVGLIGDASDATFELLDAPAGFSIDKESGAITVAKDVAPNEQYDLKVKVTYADGTSDEVATSVYVRVSTAYLVDLSYEEGSTQEGVEGTVAAKLVVKDTDTAPDIAPELMAFRLTSAPEGFTIDQNTGVITVADSVPAGDYAVAVEAIYPDGTKDVATAKVSVVGIVN